MRGGYVFLGIVPAAEHGGFGNGEPHSRCRVVEEVPAHGVVGARAGPGWVAEGTIWVEGTAVGLGVGRVVVGRVVAVGRRRRRRR